MSSNRMWLRGDDDGVEFRSLHECYDEGDHIEITVPDAHSHILDGKRGIILSVAAAKALAHWLVHIDGSVTMKDLEE